MQLVDDGRLADSRITGDEHQLRRPALDHTIEGSERGLELARSSVQLLWDHKAIGRVVLPEREIVDAVAGFPCGEAAAQIAFEAGGGLITLLGRLGEQFHNYL